jgi:hypothetical protein
VFAAEKALAISRPVTRSASLVDGWWDGARARGAARVGGDTPYAAVCMSVWGLVTLVHQQPLFCLFFYPGPTVSSPFGRSELVCSVSWLLRPIRASFYSS